MSRQTISQSIKDQLANELIARYGTTITRPQLMTVAKKFRIDQPYWLQSKKIGWGTYDISSFVAKTNQASSTPVEAETAVVTNDDILTSQRRKFRTLDRMAGGVVKQQVRSMVVSGPAGIGKTYTIEGILESAADAGTIQFTSVKGFVRPTGLYKLLWENREENQVILLDDADSAFGDEVSLNLLKGALDTSKRRVISWRSEKKFEDESGEIIPNSFEYKGSVIFITNLNFESMIAANNKLAPHFAALISRSFYIDLNLNSTKEYLIRIKDVLENTDMAYTLGLNETQTTQIMDLFTKYHNRFRELSLRMVQKVAKILMFAENDEDFRDVVETTCWKSRS